MAESLPKRLHQALDRIDRRFGTAIARHGRLAKIWIGLLDLTVGLQSDRTFMRRAILPALRAAAPRRVLFIGVRGYTRRYGDAFDHARSEFWTSDIDPAAERFGAPGRHVTADVLHIDKAFPPLRFDVVVVNGVFGWGVDEPEEMNRALATIAAVLMPGGFLLVGWNEDRIADPVTLANMALFAPAAPAGLQQRTTFADVTHVYDWYRKRP